MLSQVLLQEIREYLIYDQSTGVIRWSKVRPHTTSVNVGDVAGCLNKATGYRKITVAGHSFRASRIAWFLAHGEMPAANQYIDHIDGNRDRNVIHNLRLATFAESARNRNGNVRTSSIFKGVTFHAARGRWQAALKIGRANRYLGLYDTQEAAARAYDAAALLEHGDFARLNFPHQRVAA